MATTESSNNAYYALLALIPVVVALAGFVMWRRARSTPVELNTFEYQPFQAFAWVGLAALGRWDPSLLFFLQSHKPLVPQVSLGPPLLRRG